MDKRPPRSPGSIRADECYTLPEAGRRLSLGPAGMRQAQRHGLRAISFGRQKFVLGADVLEWLRRLAGVKPEIGN